MHPVKEIVHKVLKNDAKKALDTDAAAQFDAAKLRVVPTGGTDTSAVTLTTNGTATATNNLALGKEHVKSIVDTMKERNIDPYVGDDYMSISRPTTYRELVNDLEAVYQYTESGIQRIYQGEKGRYYATRFVEQTNIAAAGMGTPSSAWTNSKSDWAVFFGGDTVAEAVVIPEEIRGKIPSDYGRSKGVAWYAILGYGLVHTVAAETRVVLWDSAA